MNSTKLTSIILAAGLLIITGCIGKNDLDAGVTMIESKPFLIQVIIGSTRQGRISDKIAQALKNMVSSRTDVTVELIDLKEYRLPFLDDEIAPARRQKINDPLVQRWSDSVQRAQGFIIVVPEYNGSFPGVLKNALDSIYPEWHNKPVGFVGHSGGSSGAIGVIEQLHIVTKALNMIPVATSITIPHSWKAFDATGNLANGPVINQQLNHMIDEIINTRG